MVCARRFDVLLKLDRIFISDLSQQAGDAILRAIVECAHALGGEVTADGVETFAQREPCGRSAATQAGASSVAIAVG